MKEETFKEQNKTTKKNWILSGIKYNFSCSVLLTEHVCQDKSESQQKLSKAVKHFKKTSSF